MKRLSLAAGFIVLLAACGVAAGMLTSSTASRVEWELNMAREHVLAGNWQEAESSIKSAQELWDSRKVALSMLASDGEIAEISALLKCAVLKTELRDDQSLGTELLLIGCLLWNLDERERLCLHSLC